METIFAVSGREVIVNVYLANAERYSGSMIYRRCGKSGILLPAISLGLWHNFGGVDNLENSRALLCRAFSLGITHFDLANNYGPPYRAPPPANSFHTRTPHNAPTMVEPCPMA